MRYVANFVSSSHDTIVLGPVDFPCVTLPLDQSASDDFGTAAFLIESSPDHTAARAFTISFSLHDKNFLGRGILIIVTEKLTGKLSVNNNNNNNNNKKIRLGLHIFPILQTLLRGNVPKSVPLDFRLDNTFASYFYHQYY